MFLKTAVYVCSFGFISSPFLYFASVAEGMPGWAGALTATPLGAIIIYMLIERRSERIARDTAEDKERALREKHNERMQNELHRQSRAIEGLLRGVLNLTVDLKHTSPAAKAQAGAQLQELEREQRGE